MPTSFKIMILDDDEDFSSLIQIRLAALGYVSSALPSGADCVRRVQDFKPDLILLDLDMPEKNGLATFLELKSTLRPRTNGSSPAVYPVMIASGVKSEAVRELFRREGAFEYLTKPVDSNLLIAQIRKALQFFGQVVKEAS